MFFIVSSRAPVHYASIRPAGPPESFADLASRKYGKTLARRFLLAQTEKIWAVPASRLLPSVADKRFREYGLRTLLRQLAPGRNGGNGRDGEAYSYPEGGIGTIASVGLGDIEESKQDFEGASRDALVFGLSTRSTTSMAIVGSAGSWMMLWTFSFIVSGDIMSWIFSRQTQS